jgi:superfamily II DNA/RNA helicase
MRGAETSGGEWTDGAAAERGMGIVGDVVSEWVKHGEKRKTICFGATIAHCEELCRQFNEVGVMAAVFTAETQDVERESLLKEFRKPDSMLRILISVEALAKGFDVPDVSCVIDCRPLRKSLSTAIQMWGRGLRCSPETGKTDCILLDHSGNVIRFKEDFEAIYFDGLDELDCGEKLDKAVRKDEDEEQEAKGCPSCGHKPFHKRCMSCGFTIQSSSLVESQEGEMREVVMLGGKQMGEDRAHVWAQVSAYARSHSAPAGQQGRAWHLYQQITGQKAPNSWKVATTPGVEITRPVLNKIRQLNIAFAKSRNRRAA